MELRQGDGDLTMMTSVGEIYKGLNFIGTAEGMTWPIVYCIFRQEPRLELNRNSRDLHPSAVINLLAHPWCYVKILLEERQQP